MSEQRDEIRSWQLPAVDNPFEELLASVRFDDVTKGRRGAVLVKVDAGGVPIVRTTTQYRDAAQPFRAIHDRFAQQIREVAALSQPFNNALLEHYTNTYSKMKHHSDQALDLAEGSSIAVYSCYRDPERGSRRLIVKPKAGGDAFEVAMDHNSVITFSLDTNRRFTHAIALRANAPDNEWVGITFRTSKTFVRYVDGAPLLASGNRLTLADDDQRRELLQLRRRENAETDFVYPQLSYTLSESDLLPPATLSS